MPKPSNRPRYPFPNVSNLPKYEQLVSLVEHHFKRRPRSRRECRELREVLQCVPRRGDRRASLVGALQLLGPASFLFFRAKRRDETRRDETRRDETRRKQK